MPAGIFFARDNESQNMNAECDLMSLFGKIYNIEPGALKAVYDAKRGFFGEYKRMR